MAEKKPVTRKNWLVIAMPLVAILILGPIALWLAFSDPGSRGDTVNPAPTSSNVTAVAGGQAPPESPIIVKR